MKYFIQKEFKKEIKSRREFLYEILALWTFECEYNKDFLVLETMQLDFLDICFILSYN